MQKVKLVEPAKELHDAYLDFTKSGYIVGKLEFLG